MSDEFEIPPPSYRVSRGPGGLDAGTRRLILAAGGIGAVLLLLVGAWALTGHRRAAGVPVIEADSRPVRVKPDNPGGLQVAEAGDDAAEATGDGKLAPPPETPETAQLKAQLKASQSADAATAAGVLPPAPVVPPAPLPAEAKPAHPVVEASRPVAKPRPAEAAAGATAAGTTQVQLAALDTEQAARTEWERLQKRMPGLLDRRQPEVVRAEREGRVFYRLRTGGFSDMAEATEFCAQVRSKGAGCSLATF